VSSNRTPIAFIFVVLLCLPAIPHLFFVHASQNVNSPAWFLDGFTLFALLACIPIAIVVAAVASIRRRAPVWSLILSWVVIALAAAAFFLAQVRNPLAG
jgi:hypothetical protein